MVYTGGKMNNGLELSDSWFVSVYITFILPQLLLIPSPLKKSPKKLTFALSTASG